MSERFPVVPTVTFQEDVERLEEQSGCVVLFAIRSTDVVLLAARDQHENDYR